MSLGQLNVDGEMVCGFFFLPFMLHDLTYGDYSLTMYDILMANAFVVMNLVGNIMFSYGIKYGYAGRIQAIDSGQIIVQLVFAILIWN